MASKTPKKKESKDHVPNIPKDVNQVAPSTDEKAKKKPPIPVWTEWTDQDIANEKWDLTKKEKDRGRSPNASLHQFEDPEGRIELPLSLDHMVHTWKRPCDVVPAEKNPVIVDSCHLHDQSVDLLSANEHLTESELMCTIISTMTSLFQFFAPKSENGIACSAAKLKTPQKEAKDLKTEKNKKEVEPIEEPYWRPWDLIWPKESTKFYSTPVVNAAGKYAVKLFWMGSYRKIVVDDTIPCDAEMKPLLPFTTRNHELWPILISKAIIKIASLDYFGGSEASEIGDVSVVHCLTGWLPEPIPLEKLYTDKVWKLLLKLLPNWKLPKPPDASTDDPNIDRKSSSCETDASPKQELSSKDSKEKVKQKEEPSQPVAPTAPQKTTKENNQKPHKASAERTAADARNKEKAHSAVTTAAAITKPETNLPDQLLFATFSNMPINYSKISELKDLTDSSERLRRFGLSCSFPHPVHLSIVRNCPLVPPPKPVRIPRWKLIRQKKKKELVEPSCHAKEIKEPKFLVLQSPFLNYKVSGTPLIDINNTSSSKWEKYKPVTPMASLCEESFSDRELQTPDVGQQQIDDGCGGDNGDVVEKSDDCKNLLIRDERSLSFESQVSVLLPTSKSAKTSRSRETKKSILKERRQLSDHATTVAKQSLVEVQVENPLLRSNDDGDGTNNRIADNNEGILSGDADGTLPPADAVKKDDEKKDLWMEFDDFFHCFSTVWIFHKPKAHKKSSTEMKSIDTKTDKGKKSSGHTFTNAGRNAVLTPTSFFNLGNAMNDTPPPYVMVDCLEETELVIAFHSFSRWFDPNVTVPKDDKEAYKQALTPVPGSLVVEPSSWKQIFVSPPLLKIRTTGIKSAVFALSPGRHILKLMISAPLGYNVYVCSAHPFVFGDEHSVTQHQTKESLRFIAHGIDTVKQIGGIIQTFNNGSCGEPPVAKLKLGTERKSNKIRRQHFDEIFKTLRKVLRNELGTNFTPQTNFAIDALKFRAYFHLKKFASERTRRYRSRSTPLKGSSSIGLRTVKFYSQPVIRLNVDNRLETAATRIQAHFRGYYTMKLKKAHQQGTIENTSTLEQLNKIWTHIEANIESFAATFCRTMFTEKPSLLSLFPFYADEWNKISFTDYSGNYAEQPPDTWFVICRDIFYVKEPIQILPKFYCNAPGTHLKIIDNDTGKEAQTVFHRVVPQVLQKNKRGYTFIAVSHGDENPIPSGKFRLRVLGEREPLPCTLRDSFVNAQFFVNEIKEYYVPNMYSRIFRYSIKTTEDLLASIYFFTSKEDVYVKIQILDFEDILWEFEGKKYVTVDAQLFFKDRFPGSNEKKPSLPTSRTASVRSPGKQSLSSKRPLSSRKSASPDKIPKLKTIEQKVVTEDDVEEEQIHKYIIEGFVLRNSWPLTKQQWDFVETQKTAEEDENSSEQVAAKIGSTAKNNSGKTKKGGGAGGGKDAKGNRSRPESQQAQNLLDVNQPHWTMKVVVNSNMESAIEVKRDTEREDEIRSTKKAWELHEPGRAVKAQQSRAKYLEEHTIVKESSTDDDDEIFTKKTAAENSPKSKQEGAAEHDSTIATDRAISSTPSTFTVESTTLDELFVERPPKDTDPILQQFDATPFLRSSGKKILLDRYEEERIRMELEKKFQDYNDMRDMVLNLRENDRVARNAAKEKQLAEYELMQIQLDEVRNELYKAREEYKMKHLPQQEIEDRSTEMTETDKKKRSPTPPKKKAKTPSKSKKK